MPDEYRKFSQNGWKGEVLEEFRDEIALGKLEDWTQKSATRVVRQLPLRVISLFERPNQTDWYFKLLRGLGDTKETLLNSLKWRFRPSRFLRVMKISWELQKAGFKTPRVILAARKRTWWPFGHPTDVIISEAAKGRLVSCYLSGEDGLPRLEGEARQKLLGRMGRELAKLHRAGFIHGDCHPGNYFWEEGSDEFCYIDNDRTCRYATMNYTGAIRNLVSAGFYLLHRNRVTQDEWDVILEAYLLHADFSSKEAEAFKGKVSAHIQARLADDK